MSIDNKEILEDLEIKMYIPVSNISSLLWDAARGRKLKELRKIRGDMSQSDLINGLLNLGLSRTRNSITSLEKGNQDTIDKEVVLAICRVLDVNLKYFYSDIILAGVNFEGMSKHKIDKKK